MSPKTLQIDVAFSGGLGLLALWYMRKRRDPNKALWLAWVSFAGILVATALATLFVAVLVVPLIGSNATALVRAAAHIMTLSALIPAWHYANKIIRRPPWNAVRERVATDLCRRAACRLTPAPQARHPYCGAQFEASRPC